MTHRCFLSRRQALSWALGSGLSMAGLSSLGLGALASLPLSARAASTGPNASGAADWPGGKPIKVMVPTSPNELGDNMMRAFLADRLGAMLRTSIEVDNHRNGDRVADDTASVMAALSKAAPDGHTLAFIDAGWVTPPAKGQAPYDLLKGFTPIAGVFAQPVLLLATPKLSKRTVPDFPALLARAKQEPGAMAWAVHDVPHSLGRLILERIKTAAGVNFKDWGYGPDHAGRAVLDDWFPIDLADIRSGKCDVVVMAAVPAAFRQIKAGLLRPLAVAAPARLKEQLPKVPTLGELGFSDANLFYAFGFFAPAGTPLPIVEKLNRAINVQSGDAEVRHHIDVEGLVSLHGSAADFAKILAQVAN